MTQLEELKYMYLEDESPIDDYEVVIQLDRGMVKLCFNRGDNYLIVARKLRYYASVIERSVESRISDKEWER